MDPKAVAETFRQIIAGDDIPAPEGMLRTIRADKVAVRLPGFPYSIVENLWHAVFWQNIWLNKIEGKRVRSFTEDWQTPDASEYTALRKEFVSNLEKAMKIAGARTFRHKMKSDTAATKTLVSMAIHDSYHIGQINLMKRALRESKN